MSLTSKLKKHARGPGRLAIKITPTVMEQAMRANSSHCMIAEAIKNDVPWARFISVDLQTIRFTNLDKAERYVYLTPRVCQQHLVDFDQGNPVEPFVFSLSGAHVVRSQAGASSEQRARLTEKRQANKAKADNLTVRIRNKERKTNPIPVRPKIDSPISNTNVPQRVGGRTPPTMRYAGAGRRREFGIRGLK